MLQRCIVYPSSEDPDPNDGVKMHQKVLFGGFTTTYNIISGKSVLTNEWHSEEFFKAGKIAWNKGISIIISYTTLKRKVLQRKMEVFLLDTLKTFSVGNKVHKSGYFFQSQDIFSRFLERVRVDITNVSSHEHVQGLAYEAAI